MGILQGAKGAGKRTKTEARPLDRRPSPPTHARTGISPPSRDEAPESGDYDEQRRGDDIPRAHVLREKLGKGDLFRRSLQVVGLPSPRQRSSDSCGLCTYSFCWAFNCLANCLWV